MHGGSVAANMTNEWGEAGDYGCENIAGGDSVICAKLCLLCQAGPVGECDETGALLTAQAPPEQRVKGGPVRCCDLWDTRCPTCTSGSRRSCFSRCKCICDGCTAGRVWHAPDRDQLFPEDQWQNMSPVSQGGQEVSEGQEEQEEETRACTGRAGDEGGNAAEDGGIWGSCSRRGTGSTGDRMEECGGKTT